MLVTTKASSTFYIGYKIDGIRYVKNKNGNLVYSDFKTIHKSDTNELAYCIQPGVKITDEAYDEYETYNDRFFIDEVKMQKVRLIAHYGYLYENHTDINWYVATQLLIWHAVMPTTWDIYFVDSNNNRINLFENEINEINNLVANHHEKPNIDDNYIFNLNEEIVIDDEYNLLQYYKSSSGNIINNRLVIDNNLEPGDYKYSLNVINSEKPIFYNHPTGQDLFTRGEVYKNNLDFNVHITAGKVEINECDEKTFNDVFIGGTYEILDQDDLVIDEITCDEGRECLSHILPIGFHKIRVKSLSDDYENNDMIYDVEVSDNNVSSVSICSLKKEKPVNIINNTVVNVIENKVTNIYNYFNYEENKCNCNNCSEENECNLSDINININNNSNEVLEDMGMGDFTVDQFLDKESSFNNKIIDIPNTSKHFNIFIPFVIILVTYVLSYVKHEKSF